MSEEHLAQRFVQAFFAYVTRVPPDAADRYNAKKGTLKIDVSEVTEDAGGPRIRSQTAPVGVLNHPNARRFLTERLTQCRRADDDENAPGRLPLRIKRFPPDSLTVNGLLAYLDELERTHFVPDLLAVDYPDRMKYNRDNTRLEMERIYEQLRGIARDRKMAVVTVSQANRLAINAPKVIGNQHIAEAIGKVNVSDNIITYNQTADERTHGVARLFVAKGRKDVSGFLTLIGQSYQHGQFCPSSVGLAVNNGDDYLDDALEDGA